MSPEQTQQEPKSELITSADVPMTRAEVLPEARDALVAEAASRVIQGWSGAEDKTPQRGAVEVDMPADPSSVQGWTGDVRH